MPSALPRDGFGGFERGLEVVPFFDQLDAERAHRPVLAGAVSVRGHDRCRNAVNPRGEPDRLAVIAPRCGDDALHRRSAAPKEIEVDEAAAHLERAHRRLVLVLHPHARAAPFVEQRPPLLRGRAHRFVDDGRGRIEIAQSHHDHCTFV